MVIELGISKSIHLEIANGDHASNLAYCSKSTSRDGDDGSGPFEVGVATKGQGQRTDIQDAIRSFKNNPSIPNIINEHGSVYLKYYGGFNSILPFFIKPRVEPTIVYWFYGPTGTGKTRHAFEEGIRIINGDCDINDLYQRPTFNDIDNLPYFKPATSKWWDGYYGQQVTIIDDYRRDFSTFAELLRLTDRYPYIIERKGGSTKFTSKYLFITTPKSPADTWIGRSDEDIDQLVRRIHLVKHFPKSIFK